MNFLAFLFLFSILLVSCSGKKIPIDKNETDPQKVYQDIFELDLDIARSFKDKNCEQALRLLNLEDRGRFYNATEAMMLADGKCIEKNAAKAAEMLEDWLQFSPDDYISLARLGALYWEGDGVQKDEEKSQKFFKRAIITMGTELIYKTPLTVWEFDEKLSEIWGTTPKGMILGFVDADTGPWELPMPLKGEIKWLEKIVASNGQEIMEIAFYLREGTGGFEKDEAMAFNWLMIAAFPYEYVPSYYEIVKWTRDENFCSHSDEPYCTKDIFYSNVYLIDAAINGHKQAMEEVIQCLLKVPDYPKKPMAVYFWLLRSKEIGLEIQDQDLQDAESRLSDEQKELVEIWWDMGILESLAYSKLGDKILC